MAQRAHNMTTWTLNYKFAVMLVCGLTVTLAFTVSSCWAQIIAAQGQEAINAVNAEKIAELTRRITDVEGAIRYAIIALIANLIAHIAQIWSQRARVQTRPIRSESFE